MKMLVKKWGTSPAVRIPASIMAAASKFGQRSGKIRSLLML